MLDELKKIVCECNLELPRNGLVSWTSGNISARDPETGYIVSNRPESAITPCSPKIWWLLI